MAISTIQTPVSSEVLASTGTGGSEGITIIRQGKMRELVVNNFEVGAVTVELPVTDRPPHNVSTIALRRSSGYTDCQIGFVRVNTDGSLSFFRATTYGSGSVSAAANGDHVSAAVAWVV